MKLDVVRSLCPVSSDYGYSKYMSVVLLQLLKHDRFILEETQLHFFAVFSFNCIDETHCS